MRFVIVFVMMIFLAVIFQLITPEVHWLIRGLLIGACFSASGILWDKKT